MKYVTGFSENREEDALGFWESDFFKDSLSSGDFLELDFKFFATKLEGFLEKPGRERDLAMAAVQSYLKTEDFRELCQKLLLLLDDADLLQFAYHLVGFESLSPSSTPLSFVNSIVLCECKWSTFEDLLFYNTLVNFGRQVVRFLSDDQGTNNNLCNGTNLHKHPTSEQSSIFGSRRRVLLTLALWESFGAI
jgi:hypothetical protein